MNADCWNEIGVFGDSTCPELNRYHHCTSCPKYSDGARKLLDQEPPADYVSEWTAVLAREKETPAANTFALVLFRVGGHRFTLATQLFREVVEIRAIHTIPHRSNHLLLGIVNIRGTLHLCVNLKGVLNITDAASIKENNTARHIYPRMVVVEKEGKSWAFEVDEIVASHRFAPEEVVPLADAEKASRGIVEWEGETFDVLDETLFLKRLELSLE